MLRIRMIDDHDAKQFYVQSPDNEVFNFSADLVWIFYCTCKYILVVHTLAF
jgi:hypothetical protein